MRVLILSASVGAGHMRAAEAVEVALRGMGTDVTNIDVLTLMPAAFRKLYRDGYLEMIRRAPMLLGWIYDATDRPPRPGDLLRHEIERAGAIKLLQRIREINPDAVICTHFLPVTLLQRERRKGRLKARIVTVVTDYEVHSMWLAAQSDHYFVATEEARAHLLALGHAGDTITVSGIPTHPVFAERKDRAAMRRKHGWHPDLPAILISAGGFGAGNVARMVESLVEGKVPAQIVAACGRSAPLKAAVEKIRHSNVKAAGFTTDMDEFMASADLMLGKPGGLTTAESFIKGLGWVIVNPIPGQEERNAIYLLENGAGVWCDNRHTLAFKVKSLLEDPKRLAAMRAYSLRLARPDAASTIARVSARLP